MSALYFVNNNIEVSFLCLVLYTILLVLYFITFVLAFFEIKDRKAVLSSFDDFPENKLKALILYWITYVYYRLLNMSPIVDTRFILTYEVLDGILFTLGLLIIASAKLKSHKTKLAIIFF